jgi:acetoin utilization deacetylase AcuC-like enzyme
MPRRLALVTHPACFAHDTGEGHPESRARLPAIREAVREDDALSPDVLVEVDAQPALEEDLLRVHAKEHVALVRATAEEAGARGRIDFLDPDTAVSGASWTAALGAAGSAITAAELVATGHARAAFALARPPGHHARFGAAAGFCLFDNVAVAARRVQAIGLAERVLVVDWDVHHGDGTQAIFWEDPSVYVLSLHAWPQYPGTGAADERGAGAGAGTTRNVPVPVGTSARDYRRLFSGALSAALAEFTPDLVLVSAGFDCLSGDPLGGLPLEPEDLHAMTRELLDATSSSAEGRLACVLEGGYVPARAGLGVANVLRALAGLPARKARSIAPEAGLSAP